MGQGRGPINNEDDDDNDDDDDYDDDDDSNDDDAKFGQVQPSLATLSQVQ